MKSEFPHRLDDCGKESDRQVLAAGTCDMCMNSSGTNLVGDSDSGRCSRL